MECTFEQYKIFKMVADCNGFGKAAEKLFISQPAVSQAIKLLENNLEVQLFIRTQKGTILTQAGKILYKYVDNAFRQLINAENHLNDLKELKTGTLNIGASDTLCEKYLLKYLNIFHTKFPDIKLNITNRTSGETINLLKQGYVDIGFVNMPIVIENNISLKVLKTVTDCFIYNENYFPEAANIKKIEELNAFPLMMLEDISSTRKYLNSYLENKKIYLIPQIELGSHDLLLSFAKIGLGIAAVVKEYSSSILELNYMKIIELEEKIPQRNIALIYDKNRELSFSAKEFIKLL
ncbi:LysR family transcriptional regulator [Eubacteriales bacterium OttesenSCG-928-G02]|nr:LysR family transcriptional regulator [Eubacteriales bacterium OttesenSCG-928-G02]